MALYNLKLNRVHLTKAKLARIYPNTDPTCDRCKHAPATLIHMFWTCSTLRTFWLAIFKSLSEVFSMVIDPHPLIALFGVRPGDCIWPLNMHNVVAFTTLLARRQILLNWKSAKPPSHTRWIRDIMFHLKLEKIKFTLKGNKDKFNKVWMPFLTYFDNITDVSNWD